MAARSGCATALLWIAGLAIAVPGLCTLLLLNSAVTKEYAAYGPTLLWIAIAVAVGGTLYLIYDFSRGRGDDT